MHAHDGRGPPTNLVNAILNRLGLTSPEDIVRYASKFFISVIFSCYYENNILLTFMKAALFFISFMKLNGVVTHIAFIHVFTV